MVSVTTQLEQRLGATQIELRKLGSERHTLRSRLRREADRLRELESALRAEKELHAQASDEHFAAILGLRTRLVELEGELQQVRSELEQARTQPAASAAIGPTAPARASKVPQGLRRIRGIGPAYQRVLEQAGVTRVQQIAGWTEADVVAFADMLKIKPDRISKDDWIGQARGLQDVPGGDGDSAPPAPEPK